MLVSRAKLNLSAAVRALDGKSRNAFVSLANAFPEGNSTEDRLHFSPIDIYLILSLRYISYLFYLRWLGLFCTNSFHINDSPTTSALFLQISRLNHSCRYFNIAVTSIITFANYLKRKYCGHGVSVVLTILSQISDGL